MKHVKTQYFTVFLDKYGVNVSNITISSDIFINLADIVEKTGYHNDEFEVIIRGMKFTKSDIQKIAEAALQL